MHVKSINIGKIQHYNWGKNITSAIHKTPILSAIYLNYNGFKDDEQADLKNHGGLDKSVLIIPADNYAFFKINQPFGFIGENITVVGFDETTIQIGDRIVINDTIIEVTQPRSPCAKLAKIIQQKTFVKEYSASAKVGFYCRVITPGTIQINASIKLIPSLETSITIAELFAAQFVKNKTNKDWSNIKKALATTALSKAWRTKLSKLIK